jgi:hypothetical protein
MAVPRLSVARPSCLEHLMGLFALLLIAAAVRLPGIFSAPFWSDEYFSWMTATQPTFVQFFLRCAGVDVYPPLSYFPIWLIAKFSDAAWAMRLPGALAGVACVWVAVRMLRRYLSETQALSLAALIALAPLSIYLGWESKAYNFFALMNLLMMDESLRVLEKPERGWKRLALWVAGSMWSFFLSPYFILSVLVAAWWQERRRSVGFQSVLKGVLVGLLASLPLAPFFLKTLLLYSGSSAYNTELLLAPFYSFENFSAGFWIAPINQLGALFVFGVAVLAGRSQLAIGSSVSGINSERAALTKMLMSMAFLPPVLFVLVSALGKPNYNDRAMLISAFSWTLLAGFGALSLDGWFRPLMLGVLLATQGMSVFWYEIHPEVQRVNYDKAWQEITAQWQDGDVIMHGFFESGLPFKYFSAREVELGQRSQARPNYVHERDLGYSSSAPAQGIRGLWRRVNAWLGTHGMGLYAGTDPIFVDGDSLNAATSPAKRLWYVVASDEAVRRQMLPIPNAFRGGQEVGRTFNFAAEDWLRGKWKFQSQGGDDEVHIYLYVPEK